MFHQRSSSLSFHHRMHNSVSSSVYSVRSSSITNSESVSSIPEYKSMKYITNENKEQKAETSINTYIPNKNPYAESFWIQCYGEEGEEEIRKRVKNPMGVSLETNNYYKDKALPDICDSFEDLEITFSPEKSQKPPEKKKFQRISFDHDSLLANFPTPSTPDKMITVPKLIQNIIESEEVYFQKLDKIRIIHNSFLKFIHANNIVLRKKEILLMFGNFQTLMELSERFYNDLQQEIEYSKYNVDQRLIQAVENHVTRISKTYESYILLEPEREKYWEREIFTKTYLREWIEEIFPEHLSNSTPIKNLLNLPIEKLTEYYNLIKTECMETSNSSLKSGRLINCLLGIEKLLDKDKNQRMNQSQYILESCDINSPTILKIDLGNLEIEKRHKKTTLSKLTLILESVIDTFRANHKMFLRCNELITEILYKHQMACNKFLNVSEIFMHFDELETMTASQDNSQRHNQKKDNSQFVPDKFVIRKAIKSSTLTSLVTPETVLFPDRYISSTYQIYNETLRLQMQQINSLIDEFEKWMHDIYLQLNQLYEHWNTQISNKLKLFKKENRLHDSSIVVIEVGNDLAEEQVEFIFRLHKISVYYKSLMNVIACKLVKFQSDITRVQSMSKNHNHVDEKENCKGTVSYDQIVSDHRNLCRLNRKLVIDCNHLTDNGMGKILHVNKSIW